MIIPPGFQGDQQTTIDTPNSERFHQYPIWAREFNYEGSVKRFMPTPTPEDVYHYALLGLPNIFPIINEQISITDAENALVSAFTEIEASTGMDISPVIHHHAEDYIAGKFGNNCSGIKLFRWPAVKIIQVSLKFPNTDSIAYQQQIFPANWVYLRKNKMNLVPNSGPMTIQSVNQGAPGAVGYFGGFYGVNSSYSPGLISVIYQSGFDNDRLPGFVADLIKTWAAHRFLTDVGPLLFPYNNVSVSIDAVSQSTGITLGAVITAKLQALEIKKTQLLNAAEQQFGTGAIKSTYIGT